MFIWKCPLLPISVQTIEIPHSARLLSVQVQNDQPHLFALVVDSEYKDRRSIAIYETGELISDKPYNYIDTFKIPSNDMVFHVFELLD